MASTGAKKRVKPGKNVAAIPSSINPPPALAPPAFDLVALRAAAFNSKKRKAAAEASSSSSKKSRPEESVHILEDDMEEGEIEGDASEEGELTGARDSDIVFLEEEDDDDDLIIIESSDPHVRLALHSTSQTSRQQSTSNNLSEYRRESIPPPSIEHIRDEAIQVIRQLLDHGVSPEYLVDYGVSKDIIAIAFHELGLKLPTHLAQSAPFSPSHDPHPSLAPDSIQPAINPHFKPRLSLSPPPSDYYYNNPPPPIDSAELMATEARKKEELLARKRALAGRNAEKADSFLDTLFSASLPVAAPLASASSASSSTSSPRISPPVLLAASSVPRTRESSHEAEGISSRRPVAIDFEALPPKSSAPPRRIALAYIDEEVSRPKKLVIEVSESESESDSEDEDAEVISSIVTRTMLPNAPSAPSLPKLPLSATTPSTPTIPSFEAIIEAKEANVQKELGAKELEIKMIMEKIAQMSKRKKSSNGTASGGSTPVLVAMTAPATLASASQVLSNPLPVASTSQLIQGQGGGSEKAKRVAVEAALKRVDVLQVERSLLIKEAEAIVEKREGAELDVDESEESPLEVHKNGKSF